MAKTKTYKKEEILKYFKDNGGLNRQTARTWDISAIASYIRQTMPCSYYSSVKAAQDLKLIYG